jgi:DMSO/TMAO reductase YedYZ heme-binding membrane subunit
MITLKIIIALGITTATFVILTAVLGSMILKGKTKLTIKDHRTLAMIAIILLVIHATAVLVYLFQ